MPKNVQLLRVFVSSPGDVKEERAVLDEVIRRVNDSDGDRKSVRLELFRWEHDVVPSITGSPQGVVNAQTPDYDIYLGVLATRFGTPTQSYGSGTEEEFYAALNTLDNPEHGGRKRWILVYFKDSPVRMSTCEEAEQYRKVLAFKERLGKLGILGTYEVVRGSEQGFFEKVQHDLRIVVHELSLGRPTPTPVENRILPRVEPLAVDDEEESEDEQFGKTEGPTEADARAALVAKLESQIFDVISPCYLLDENFFFLDWNIAFDELFARPLGLARGDHALDFVRKLANCEAVIEHSKETFGAGRENPIVDTEVLQINSPKYGLIECAKIAAQLTDDNGGLVAWVVNLNVILAEKNEELRRDFEAMLKDKLNWTRYAFSYDRLLLPFTDYHELVDRVVSRVGDAQRCIDLGAGTGNGTLRLLETNLHRLVWAVDSSDGMLRHLRRKLRSLGEPGRGFRDRLIQIKDDILRLTSLRDKDGFFDAAILINVLYAVEDPVECLRQANRLLKPGGCLVLSTPHQDTDVNALFQRMKEVLRDKYRALKSNFDDAIEVHRRMDHLIHRDSKDDIRRYLDEAGFTITEWLDNEYVNSVVVVRAVKNAAL